MAWFTLLIAAMFEVLFASSLKPSEGFTRPIPSVCVIVFGSVAVVLLSKTLHSIPVGTAYAVFTALGAVGVVAVGIVAFDEEASPARLACIALIVLGVIGLRVISPAP